MALHTFELAQIPAHLPVHVALYHDVRNAAFLKQQLQSGNLDFEYAFIDAALLLSTAHALAAVYRGLHDHLHGRRRSRNVHAEIVFSLSPTNNMAEAFRRFGIGEATNVMLVVKVSTSPLITHDSVQQHLDTIIQGKAVPFSDQNLALTTDLPRLRKIYKLNNGRGLAMASAAADASEAANLREMECAILGAIALPGPKNQTDGARRGAKPRKPKTQATTIVGQITKRAAAEQDKRPNRAGKATKQAEQQPPLTTTATATTDKDEQGAKAGRGRVLREKFNGEPGNLCLDAAVKRRTDWTPPRDTVAVLDLSATMPGTPRSTSAVDLADLAPGFGSVCRPFFYEGAGGEAGAKPSSRPMMKRQRAESQTTSTTEPPSHGHRTQPNSKPKAVKKKAKTITAHATAPYAAQHPQPPSGPLARYLSQDHERLAGRGLGSAAEIPAPAQPCLAESNAPRKKTKRQAKKKDPKPPSVLLSPRSACRQIEGQAFLFGTSSQLAREESPAVMRDLRKIRGASEVFQEPGISTRVGLATLSRSGDSESQPAGRDPGKSLWSVAATDLADQAGYQPSTSSSTGIKKTAPSEGRCESTARLEPLPASEQSVPEGKMTSKETMPDFEGYPTTKLAAELASYGFKPTKVRKRMIALMQKCWEGKQRMALAAVETNTHLTPADAQTGAGAIKRRPDKVAPTHITSLGATNENSAPTAKRPRGRPTKKMAVEGVDGEQAKGSSRDTQEHASPSRAKLKKRATPDLHLNMPSVISPQRFAYITKAIRSETPSTRADSPTWFEKILVYDPIVLDDLARWLNAEGLAAAGAEFEVGPIEVRTWCQERGVCCLWKESLRGEERSRY
ncbi:MAG: hypothetical protein M1826_000191 [Phylliscum demangeonii]|nr:MAG: hypothetical protein M1826_000191 [Phylliscum demangeonii]